MAPRLLLGVAVGLCSWMGSTAHLAVRGVVQWYKGWGRLRRHQRLLGPVHGVLRDVSPPRGLPRRAKWGSPTATDPRRPPSPSHKKVSNTYVLGLPQQIQLHPLGPSTRGAAVR